MPAVPKPDPPPKKKPSRLGRNAARMRKRFESDFGGEEYHDLIVSMPCAVCGIQGYTVAAHLKTRGSGGKADDVGPLCRSRFGVKGCHERYDDHDPEIRKHEPRLRAEAKERWTHFQSQRSTHD